MRPSFRFLSLKLHPFCIARLNEMQEPPVVISGDVVVCGIAADGEIGDRRLSAKGPIETVVPQVFPGAEVERKPRLIFGSLFPFGYFDKRRFFRVFICEALKPAGPASVGQVPAEGRPDFGVVSSTNLTSSFAT